MSNFKRGDLVYTSTDVYYVTSHLNHYVGLVLDVSYDEAHQKEILHLLNFHCRLRDSSSHLSCCDGFIISLVRDFLLNNKASYDSYNVSYQRMDEGTVSDFFPGIDAGAQNLYVYGVPSDVFTVLDSTNRKKLFSTGAFSSLHISPSLHEALDAYLLPFIPVSRFPTLTL